MLCLIQGLGGCGVLWPSRFLWLFCRFLIIENSLIIGFTKKYGLLAGDKKCCEFQGKES